MITAKSFSSVTLTPVLAQEYLNKYNNYPAQRVPRPVHVDELAAKMVDGRFHEGRICLATLDDGDSKTTHLLDGQHVCLACIKSGTTVQIRLYKPTCDEEIDLATLFKQFENQARSISDFNNAEAIALGVGWQNWIVNLIVGAAAFDRVPTLRMSNSSGDAGGKKKAGVTEFTKERKSQLLREYLREGMFVNKIMTSLPGNGDVARSIHVRHLRKVPVVYAMIKTWAKNQKDAETFWMRVRDGEQLTKDMPEMKLREFLIQINSIHAGSQYSYRKATNHELIYRCVNAWNAFRTNQPTNLRYYFDKPIPSFK